MFSRSALGVAGKSAFLVACLVSALACGSDGNGRNTAGSGGFGGLAGTTGGTGIAGDGSFGGTDGAGTFAAGSGGVSGVGAGGTTAAVGGTGGESGTAAGAAGTDAGGGGTGAGTGGAGGTGGTGSTWPAATAFDQKGTFPTTMEAGGSACTVFRPMTLGEEGRMHPAIVWGNGTTNSPSNYTALFTHLASHGFIVIAANTSNAGSGKEMIACLDWLFMQNDAAGPYQGKVDKANVAASGYSQGGAGTLMAALDSRFKVQLPVSPYIVLPLGGYDSTAVGKQTKPMFMISGTADAVAVPADNQMPIFMQAKVPIIWGTFTGATHFEVLNDGGHYRGPMTAFFRYELMGDSAAKDWFEDPPCTLCSTSGWAVMHNAMWQ